MKKFALGAFCGTILGSYATINLVLRSDTVRQVLARAISDKMYQLMYGEAPGIRRYNRPPTYGYAKKKEA